MRLGRVREPPNETNPSSEGTPTTAEMRHMGDSCRDRGLWLDGSRHYGSYLEQNPNDAAIWVQLGHCLKESGLHHDAEKAYDRALNLGGEDHDIFLHKGHLAKIMGSTGDATYYYKRSLALCQDNNDALRELLALGALDTIQEILPSYRESENVSIVTIYLDITDLIEYAKQNSSLSGIQRVVSNIAKYSTSPLAQSSSFRVRTVIPEYDREVIFSVNAFVVCFLIELLESSEPDRHIIDHAIRAVYQSRQRVDPEPKDIFIIAGAFWIYDHYDMIATLRARGMRFGVFVHDLIDSESRIRTSRGHPGIP